MEQPNKPDKSTPTHRGLFEQPRRQDEAKNGDNRRKPFPWWKLGVVALVVAAAILVKVGRDCCTPSSTSGPGAAEKAAKSFPGHTVLATVADKPITLEQLDHELAGLPPQYRATYERQKHEFLEELIVRKLLLLEAQRKKVSELPEYDAAISEHADHPGHEEHVLTDVLLRTQVLNSVEATDEDLRTFYEEHKDELPGRPSFEDARNMIEPSVLQQKQYEAIMTYIGTLRDESSEVTRNEAWVEAQTALAAENPLDHALASGKPVLADFGRGTCIPCKVMAPILEELAKELEGKVHVLVLDTEEYGYLASRYRVRIIPTQIFFDASGKEMERHQGFMSKEDLLGRLTALGMLRP